MTNVAQLSVGFVFSNRYVIERLLKAGGMGAVYVAVQSSTGERVALKVLHPGLVTDPQARARFEQEARVGTLFSSPGVVKVMDADVDSTSGIPFLAMELLRGCELGELLAARGRLQPEEVVRHLTQIARTLDKAHAAGVVHRDLKPGNLFVVEATDEEPERVKILDFGIAKLTLAATSQTTQAQGTPHFMAPEQLSPGAVGTAADIWPLGLIAYVLLVGHLYWQTETIAGLYGELLSGSYEAPSARASRHGVTLPPGFDAWFFRCVALDPSRRFSRASEAIASLVAAVGTAPFEQASPAPQGEPASVEVSANAPAGTATAPAEDAWTGLRPHRAPLYAAAVVILAAVGLGVALARDRASDSSSTTDTSNNDATGRKLKGDYVQLALGGDLTCARAGDGKVRCWGGNSSGQLGDGTKLGGATPKEVAQLTDAVQIVGGSSHACARRQGGRVVCWGANFRGQLGDGTLEERLLPTPVVALEDAGEIAASGRHMCAVMTSGKVACWGETHDPYRLAPADFIKPRVDPSRPHEIELLGKQARIGVGGHYACAIDALGTANCWGENTDGQLGVGDSNERDTPVEVLKDVEQIVAASNSTCARTKKRTVKCWGSNIRGALGDGTTESRSSPSEVPNLAEVVQLAAGSWHFCARLQGGTVRCWGGNDSGQLGDGSKNQALAPVAVPKLKGVVDLAAGDEHTCALLDDGSIWCWGRNDSDQLGYESESACEHMGTHRCSLTPGRVGPAR